MSSAIARNHCVSIVPESFYPMIRRPPSSTLFPYTRSSDLGLWAITLAMWDWMRSAPATWIIVWLVAGVGSLIAARLRSEEHTSELQSRVDLVCRLLLEKKNPTTSAMSPPIRSTENESIRDL